MGAPGPEPVSEADIVAHPGSDEALTGTLPEKSKIPKGEVLNLQLPDFAEPKSEPKAKE